MLLMGIASILFQLISYRKKICPGPQFKIRVTVVSKIKLLLKEFNKTEISKTSPLLY